MEWERVDLSNPENWPTERFLAAVQGGDGTWDYVVLTVDERGNLEQDGDAWGAWGVEDIEWIARIEKPGEDA